MLLKGNQHSRKVIQFPWVCPIPGQNQDAAFQEPDAKKEDILQERSLDMHPIVVACIGCNLYPLTSSKGPLMPRPFQAQGSPGNPSVTPSQVACELTFPQPQRCSCALATDEARQIMGHTKVNPQKRRNSGTRICQDHVTGQKTGNHGS